MTRELITIIIISFSAFIVCTVLAFLALRHHLFYGSIVRNSSSHVAESIDKVGIPFVTVSNGDKTLNFIIDTGSNLSYLDSRYLDWFKAKDLNKSTKTVGAGGSLETHHYVISFDYNGRKFKDVVGSVDLQHAFGQIKDESGIEIHGILGVQFLRSNHFVIDFDTLNFYQMKNRKKKRKTRYSRK